MQQTLPTKRPTPLNSFVGRLAYASSSTMAQTLLFAIGASGAGKTAAVAALGRRQVPDLACLHFDSIGVPSLHDMTLSHGTPERWQEVATQEWIRRVEQVSARTVILEGQTRPSFIHTPHTGLRIGVVLLDCDLPTRSARLRGPRGQPELDSLDMQHWATYLRGQADALRLPVIDTTIATPEEVADALLALAYTIPAWAKA